MKLSAIWKAQKGSTFVFIAIAMAVIVGFVGLAIDVGALRYARHHLQSAADAAAIAAALELSYCGSTANCAALQTAVQSAVQENGFAVNTVIANCAASAANGLTIAINNPPCSQGSADPNSGKAGYVEIVVSETEPTYFAAAIGFRSVPIAVHAESTTTTNPNCIYALDSSGGNAITVDALAGISTTCGIVDESSAWNALSCNLLAKLTAPQISVTGGVQQFLCTISPTPKVSAPVPSLADPLASLPKPAVPSCGSSTGTPYHGSSLPLSIVGNATLYPDAAYCGGITILPGANVTFMPGVYVLKSVGILGGMTISLLSNVSGNGVTFYNLGPYGGITFVASSVTLGGVNLSAPTSGTYSCILFFQDPQNTVGATILGSTSWNTMLQGTYYFPTASVLYAASSPVSYNILVAKDIEFAALTYGTISLTSSFASNYSSVSSGCPMSGGGSVLVE